MRKRRKLLGTDILDKAIKLYVKNIPIATIVRLLELDTEIHYRTAYDIIRADVAGNIDATRPRWLQATPAVQTAPDGWHLIRGLEGHWEER